MLDSDPIRLESRPGPAATDLPHIFSAAWVYELPFGKDRFSSSSRVLNYLIGGWTLNGILSFSSGQPFDAGASGDIANTGNLSYTTGYGYERANLVGNPVPVATSRRTSGWTRRRSRFPRNLHSEIWAGTPCVATGRRISIFRSSNGFRLRREYGSNFALKLSTSPILRCGDCRRITSTALTSESCRAPQIRHGSCNSG